MKTIAKLDFRNRKMPANVICVVLTQASILVLKIYVFKSTGIFHWPSYLVTIENLVIDFLVLSLGNF